MFRNHQCRCFRSNTHFECIQRETRVIGFHPLSSAVIEFQQRAPLTEYGNGGYIIDPWGRKSRSAETGFDWDICVIRCVSAQRKDLFFFRLFTIL